MRTQEALRTAHKTLGEASGSPELDAELLLAHVLRTDRSGLRMIDEVAAGPLKEFKALVARRGKGEPVAYLTGTKEFWSLPITVTPDVLVPRPETELLVQWGIESVGHEQSPRIADLGTGSGCIALALAKEIPGATVVAVDQSGQAIQIALGNAQRLNLRNVQFRRASFEDFLGSPSKQPYDLIVSNPPYVAEDDPHLEALRHEPQAALEAGRDGLRDLKIIIAGAPNLLDRGGRLIVEHGADQGNSVRRLMQTAGLKQIETRPDLAGNERATSGRRT